jgi:hypothetical protein
MLEDIVGGLGLQSSDASYNRIYTSSIDDTHDLVLKELDNDLIVQTILPLLEELNALEDADYLEVAFTVLMDRYTSFEERIRDKIWNSDQLSSTNIEVPVNSTATIDQLVYSTGPIHYSGMTFELLLDEDLMDVWTYDNGTYSKVPLMVYSSIWNPMVFMNDEEMELDITSKQALFDDHGYLPQFDVEDDHPYSELLSNVLYLSEIARQIFSLCVMPESYWVSLLSNFSPADIDYLYGSYYAILMDKMFDNKQNIVLEAGAGYVNSTYGEYFEMIIDACIASSLSTWKYESMAWGTHALSTIIMSDQIQKNNNLYFRGVEESKILQYNDMGRYLFPASRLRTRFDDLFSDNVDEVESYLNNQPNMFLQFYRLLKSPSAFSTPLADVVELAPSIDTIAWLQNYFGNPGQMFPNYNTVYDLSNRMARTFRTYYDALDIEYVSFLNDFMGLFTIGGPKTDPNGMNPILGLWLGILEANNYDDGYTATKFRQKILEKFI